MKYEGERTLTQHRRRIYSNSFLGAHVGPVLEVVVLALLLGLEPEPRQSPEVLLADRLVDRRAPLNPLAVVVGDVRPPATAVSRGAVLTRVVSVRRGRGGGREAATPSSPS